VPTIIRETAWERLRVSPPAVLVKTLVKWSVDRAVEWQLGIQTAGSTLATHRAGGEHHDSNWYEQINYITLGRCLRAMELTADDVVFDIGCGLSRVICILARLPIRKCVGIDLDPAFVERAKENVAVARGKRAQVQVLVADAATADYDEGTAFYLYNSFGAATMNAFLEQLHQSVLRRPRPIRICYLNPMQNHVFEGTPWLTPAGEARSPWYETYATLWRYEPPGA
jgi:SAM-dependent methyltransferase